MIQDNQTLDFNIITPALAPHGTLVFLHGLGGRGNDFVTVTQELQNYANLNCQVILPQAPKLAVTVNGGALMPAWYDIFAFGRERPIDQEGIASSVAKIADMITKLPMIAGRKPIIGGFSQGAVIALATLFAHPDLVSGIIALSGYLPTTNLLHCTHNIPIFMAHGSSDDVVSYADGKLAYQLLQQAQYNVTWHEYAMGHSICHRELQDIGAWLSTVMT